MIGNLLSAVGCIALLAAAAVVLLAWAFVSSEPGRLVAARLLARLPAAPPRPVPDDLRPRGEK